MEQDVIFSLENGLARICLNRPKALNSLSLAMIRAITGQLLAWREDQAVEAVLIYSSSEKAFCAGGDIRFFYDVGTKTPQGDSALLEDFFTEEYALNHLIHYYPKPYIALMNGIVMGGGMGIAQAGPECRLRIVTDTTKMAMPEVNIGLFPDVGGSYFLAQTPGQIGPYLGLTGAIIKAADAIYAGLADLYLPSAQTAQLIADLGHIPGREAAKFIRQFCAAAMTELPASTLSEQRRLIDEVFAQATVPAILNKLLAAPDDFAKTTHQLILSRSPLMMAVTLEQLRRGKTMSVADCLRMERDMVRHCFKHGEVLEGVRALVIDKDNQAKWSIANVNDVHADQVAAFFAPVWPAYAHPLRHLD